MRQRDRNSRFSALVLSLLFAAVPTSQAQQNQNAPVRGVDAITTTVSDMDRAVDFYSKVLTFEKISDVEVAGEQYEHLEGIFGVRIRSVRMRLGDESIELMQFLVPQGRPIPAASHSNDLWFQHIAIIVSDMDRAYAILRDHQITFASTGPQTLPDWNPSAAGIQAFYFKDPDGHPLEILHFPANKGLAKWHAKSGKVFLGIDHTAIAVADTEASLRFYRDLLGMKIVGTSENYGTEQEHLNNVFGARLKITSLRAAEGPGVELLEYLSPRDGRLFPSDEHANDVVHRQTDVFTGDLAGVAKRLEEHHVPEISTSIVGLTQSEIGFAEALLVRDADGHAVEIRQASR